MGFSPGVGRVSDLSDVITSSPADTQVLTFDGNLGKWKNAVVPANASVSSANITDATSIGRSVLTAVNASAARTSIGAGTSNLTIGTTNTTAKAGDYVPTADQITETTNNKVLTSAERVKLSGIATNATVNSTDAQLRDRTTHTGSQAISTISSLQAELDTREVIVRWNSSTHAWAARPITAAFGVIFLSTNDPAATAPTDTNKQVGDLWRRHPDAT
jgi:hypothetical protein